MAWLGEYEPTLNVSSCPGMRSTSARMYKPFPTTMEMIPAIGPGYYTVRDPEETKLGMKLGAGGDRFEAKIGFLRKSETEMNPNIKPGMYDPYRWQEYIREQKRLQGERCAKKEMEHAKRSPSKFPTTKYQLDCAEEVSNRPHLDLTAMEKSFWNRGINMSGSDRWTPRKGKLRRANPKGYLKKATGNVNGMNKIAWEYGRMRPASKVVKRDRLHFTPGALGPPQQPNTPDKRPKTAFAKPYKPPVHSPRCKDNKDLSFLSECEDEGVVIDAQKRAAEPNFPVAITDMSYRIKKMGNVYKTSFHSKVSRSPRTNPMCPVTDTMKNLDMGPGYYEI